MKQTIKSGASLATAALAIARQGGVASIARRPGRARRHGKVTCGGCLQLAR